MKIKQKTQAKYAWYLSCSRTDEPRPLEQIPMEEGGVSALEAFHAFESRGERLGCREPLLLERFFKGKEWHGVTVKTVAEDYVGRVVFSKEIKEGYPEWVADEIFAAAARIAINTKSIGYVPTFIRDKRDFSETVKLPSGEYGFA